MKAKIISWLIPIIAALIVGALACYWGASECINDPNTFIKAEK